MRQWANVVKSLNRVVGMAEEGEAAEEEEEEDEEEDSNWVSCTSNCWGWLWNVGEVREGIGVEYSSSSMMLLLLLLVLLLLFEVFCLSLLQ